MRAESILHNLSESVLSWMHAKRRFALQKVVYSAAAGGKLTVTGLGRSMKSAAREKHCIKCSDRLLSNSHLQAERIGVYRAISHQVLRAVRRPVILVDWSDLNERHGLYLLRASVAVESRALTLYEEVHPAATKERPETHRVFLATLKQVLPPGVVPVIITDAGFRAPWFNAITALGWDWIGRIRNRTLVQRKSEAAWRPCKSLYKLSEARPKFLGSALITQSNPVQCSLVLYKGKPKGRTKRTLASHRCRASASKKHSAREREPWLLATSLHPSNEIAKRVVKLYSMRMQIEEAFRDLKSARHGLSLEYSNTKTPQRLALLVLIGSLANLLLWLLGKALQLSKQHRQFQANTITKKNILSPTFLGQRLVQTERVRVYLSEVERAVHEVRRIIRSYALDY